MNFLDRIKSRSPEYDEIYYEFILDFTIEQGGKMGTAKEEEKWEQGKYFSTRYEMYMYATLLGLKNDYFVPLKGENEESTTKTKKFIDMNSWKPEKITDYIIMGILGKGDYDLFEIEKMKEQEMEKVITSIKKDIEGYANGGFDKIRSKKEENENFFVENENSFIDLLEE